MPVPPIPEFNKLVESFTLQEPTNGDGYTSSTLVPITDQIEAVEPGVIAWRSPIVLWFQESEGFSLASFRKWFNRELTKRNHAVSEPILSALVGLAALAMDLGAPRKGFMGEFLKHIGATDLVQLCVLGPAMTQETCQWKGFSFEPVNIQKLSYRYERAGWKFDAKDSDDLSRRLSVVSPPRSITAFWWSTNFPLKESAKHLFTELLPYYYRVLSDFHIEEMWQCLDESQHLFSMFDCDLADFRMVRLHPLMQRFSFFRNRSSDIPFGYVNRIRRGPVPSFPPNVKSAEELAKKYDFKDFSKTELHQTLKTFVRFTHSGKQCVSDRLWGQAFLNYMIALEVFFSDSEATTSKVSSRVAALICNHFSQSFGDARKQMKRLYCVRSAYVHRGEPVSLEDVDQLERITREVTSALLRLQSRGDSHSDGFMEKWIKNLDFIAAALEAGQAADARFLTEQGIEVGGHA